MKFSGKKILSGIMVFAVIITMFGSVGFAADINSGLIANYKFDGDFKDSVSGTDCTKTGDVTFTDDAVFGKALNVGKGFLTSSNEALKNLGNKFTISAWVKNNEESYGGTDSRSIISGFDGNLYNAYNLHANGTDACRMDFFIADGPGAVVESGGYNFKEKWSLITITYDGNTLYSYVDGQMGSNRTITEFGGKDNDAVMAATKVVIGAQSTGGDYYNGKIDDLRVYNRALSDDEIKALYAQSVAQYTNKIILTIGSNKMLVDSNEIAIDPASEYTYPVIENDRTMVPIRAIIESMGGKIGWDEAAQRVDISLKSTTVKLVINSKTADVNGKKITLDVPAMVRNDRTMLPLRFVIENLGAKVEWDGANQKITILYSK